MPGNAYGIALPSSGPHVVSAGADVTLTAGTETTFFTEAAGAPNQGNYQYIVWLNLWVSFGASAPTALVFAAKIGAGSDFDSVTVDPASLVASTHVQYNFMLFSPESSTNYVGAGSTINITGLATTNNATLLHLYSRGIRLIYRVNDSYA